MERMEERREPMMLESLYIASIGVAWTCLGLCAMKKKMDCNLKTIIGVTVISVVWPLSLVIYLFSCTCDTIDEFTKK